MDKDLINFYKNRKIIRVFTDTYGFTLYNENREFKAIYVDESFKEETYKYNEADFSYVYIPISFINDAGLPLNHGEIVRVLSGAKQVFLNQSRKNKDNIIFK